MPVAAQFLTHTVDNQAPPLRDLNLYASDVALHKAVVREGASWDSWFDSCDVSTDFMTERGQGSEPQRRA